MKVIHFLFFTLLVFLTLNSSYAQTGTFKVRADGFVQIGYQNYNVLTLGQGSPTHPTQNNGAWGIEHWNGGLNIFRPWPVFSAGNYKFFIKDWDGFVGIGKYPNHKLDVAGDIATNGTVQITSDERLKQNIRPMNSTNCLSLINQLNSYTYQYKLDNTFFFPNVENNEELSEIKQKTIEEDKITVENRMRRGFKAQEVQAIIPDIVKQTEDGFYSIDYISLIPILVEGMKEQQNTIERLEKEIEILKNK